MAHPYALCAERSKPLNTFFKDANGLDKCGRKEEDTLVKPAWVKDL